VKNEFVTFKKFSVLEIPTLVYKVENIMTIFFLKAYAVLNRRRVKILIIKNKILKLYNNQNLFLNSKFFVL